MAGFLLSIIILLLILTIGYYYFHKSGRLYNIRKNRYDEKLLQLTKKLINCNDFSTDTNASNCAIYMSKTSAFDYYNKDCSKSINIIKFTPNTSTTVNPITNKPCNLINTGNPSNLGIENVKEIWIKNLSNVPLTVNSITIQYIKDDFIIQSNPINKQNTAIVKDFTYKKVLNPTSLVLDLHDYVSVFEPEMKYYEIFNISLDLSSSSKIPILIELFTDDQRYMFMTCSFKNVLTLKFIDDTKWYLDRNKAGFCSTTVYEKDLIDLKAKDTKCKYQAYLRNNNNMVLANTIPNNNKPGIKDIKTFTLTNKGPNDLLIDEVGVYYYDPVSKYIKYNKVSYRTDHYNETYIAEAREFIAMIKDMINNSATPAGSNARSNKFINREHLADPTSVDPTLADPTSVDPTSVDLSIYMDPTLVDPTLVDPTLVDPTLVDSTLVDSTLVDPTLVNPTLVDISTEITAPLVDNDIDRFCVADIITCDLTLGSLTSDGIEIFAIELLTHINSDNSTFSNIEVNLTLGTTTYMFDTYITDGISRISLVRTAPYTYAVPAIIINPSAIGCGTNNAFSENGYGIIKQSDLIYGIESTPSIVGKKVVDIEGTKPNKFGIALQKLSISSTEPFTFNGFTIYYNNYMTKFISSSKLKSAIDQQGGHLSFTDEQLSINAKEECIAFITASDIEDAFVRNKLQSFDKYSTILDSLLKNTQVQRLSFSIVSNKYIPVTIKLYPTMSDVGYKSVDHYVINTCVSNNDIYLDLVGYPVPVTSLFDSLRTPSQSSSHVLTYLDLDESKPVNLFDPNSIGMFRVRDEPLTVASGQELLNKYVPGNARIPVSGISSINLIIMDPDIIVNNSYIGIYYYVNNKMEFKKLNRYMVRYNERNTHQHYSRPFDIFNVPVGNTALFDNQSVLGVDIDTTLNIYEVEIGMNSNNEVSNSNLFINIETIGGSYVNALKIGSGIVNIAMSGRTNYTTRRNLVTYNYVESKNALIKVNMAKMPTNNEYSIEYLVPVTLATTPATPAYASITYGTIPDISTAAVAGLDNFIGLLLINRDLNTITISSVAIYTWDSIMIRTDITKNLLLTSTSLASLATESVIKFDLLPTESIYYTTFDNPVKCHRIEIEYINTSNSILEAHIIFSKQNTIRAYSIVFPIKNNSNATPPNQNKVAIDMSVN
jgi:hypothetical protein